MITKRLPLLLAALSLLAGCTSVNVASERLSNEAEERLSQRKNLGVNSQNLDYLEPEAGMFLSLDHPDLPAPFKERLGQRIHQRTAQLGFFQALRPHGELQAKLEENRPLRFRSEVYFDSLNTLAVSDRDIANPMGKYLEVGDFLVYQVVLWPCPTCKNRSIMRLKLRLVDAHSGRIVWTATAERELYESELGQADQIGLELTDQLADLFESRFKIKWHKARFNNLAKG